MKSANGMAAMSNSNGHDVDADCIIRSGKVSRGPVDLPLDITEKILRCISPLESVRLATVCKSWESTVSHQLATPFVPHLFVTETVPTPPDKFHLRGYMVSVPLDGSARLPPPAIIPVRKNLEHLLSQGGAKVIGVTAGGRLALAISKEVFFINPVTDVSETLNVVGVPGCTGLAGNGGDTVLSHDNEVFVSHHGPRARTRLYCREHGSGEWSCGAVRDVGYYFSGISSLAKCNGAVYVLYWNGSMSRINTKARQPLVIRDLYCFTPWWRQEDHSLASNKDYLLESDGEVLFVRQLLRQKAKTCPCDYHRLYQTVGFEVYKLDEIGRQWEKVEMLDGDRALFVSTRSSFSVRASQMAACRSNCVYFVVESQHCGTCREECMSTWGVYSMEQGKVLFEHTVVVTERRTVARWFRPSVVWASHKRA